MRQFSIKRILTASFLFIAVTAVFLGLIQRCIWLHEHERKRIEQDYSPVAEAMAKIIEDSLNKRLIVLSRVSEEVLKAGINAGKLQNIVESVHYRNPDFKTIWVGSPQGKAIAFSPLYDKKGNKNLGRDYKWFKKVTEMKKPIIGDILIGKVTGEPVIPLAAPILDKNNESTGFWVVGAYNPDSIRQTVRSIKIYGKGNLTLVDNSGKTIAMSNS